MMKTRFGAVLAVAMSFFGPALGQDREAHETVRIEHVSSSECRAPCDRIAVFFIHGLTGTRETWRNETTDAWWPSLLAEDPEMSDRLDVFSIEYDSNNFSGPPVVTIIKGLRSKLDLLLYEKKYKKVIFVGHSLGGNIARAYLLHVKARYGHRALSIFRLVFSLATPTEGSSLAKLVAWVSGNEQMRTLTPIEINDFQQLLNFATDQILTKHHLVYCPKLDFYSAYEEEPMLIGGLIVSRQSATSDAVVQRGFARDHIQIAKPQGRDDPLYVWVADSIAACISGDGVCIGEIAPDCGKTEDGIPDPTLLNTLDGLSQ